MLIIKPLLFNAFGEIRMHFLFFNEVSWHNNCTYISVEAIIVLTIVLTGAK